MVQLLIVNISEQQCSPIIRALKKNSLDVDYLRMSDHTEITQELIDNSYWDAVIVSGDQDQPAKVLHSITEQFPRTPIIFFSEDHNFQCYNDAIAAGACDCISLSDLYRLPTILRKELSSDTFSTQSHDITRSAGILSDIIDLSTEDIFLFDARELTCYYFNRTAVLNLGYGRSELSHISALDIYVEYENDAFTSLIQPLLNNKQQEISICTNIKRKAGVVYPAEVRLKKVTHDGHPYLLAINKDISDNWYKVQKLKQQRSRADNYVSLHQQKEELLANAAHDMRTSLQSIILSNKLLFDQQPGDFKQGFAKFQKAIHFSGKHLLNYINEFFDPGHRSGGASNITSDSLDIESFTQKLFLVFKPIAQRNDITFELNTSGLKHRHISTNQTYVKRILKNLLSNAFKFTNEGGVTFEVFSMAAKNYKDFPVDANFALAFKVQDTGIGIPIDQQGKIFGRRNRTENSKQGTGLGLHICKELTRAISGAIKVESDAKTGSAFTLYLPAQAPAPNTHISQSSNGHAPSEKAIANQNKTILIVDDSEIHNLAIKEYLQYTFEECITANNLEKARKILEERTIHCIVTDFIIHEDNCLSFIEVLRNNENYSGIPTIVYTGKKLKDSEQDSILLDADAIVKKNAGSYDRLVDTIISCFRTDSLMNSKSRK